MHRLTAILVALGLALPAVPALAGLTVMTPELCGPGEYMVGVHGRSGDWIDAIGPVCESWNPATRTAGLPRNGPLHGGPGGGAGVAICPRGSAVSGMEIRHVRRGEFDVLLQYVAPQCRTILPPRDIVEIGRLQFGRGNPPLPSAGPTFYGCKPRELAVGLSHAVGDSYVSDIRLECRFVPSPSVQMSSRNTPSETRLYSNPTIEVASGERIALDICREWASNCGAPAAAAFCRSQNYRTAVAFDPAPRLGFTAVITGGRICNDPNCGSFRTIECGNFPAGHGSTTSGPVISVQPPSTPVPAQIPPAQVSGVIYPDPEIAADNGDMVKLDYCREWGSACGKPAADAYCRMLGHAASGRSEIDNDIGHTAIISNKAICDSPTCDGFKLIECVD